MIVCCLEVLLFGSSSQVQSGPTSTGQRTQDGFLDTLAKFEFNIMAFDLTCVPNTSRAPSDEDITPSGATIDYKVSSFLYLHNDKTRNWLLPNIGIPNVCRNNGNDDREWICHEQNQSQSANPSKLNFQFVGGPIVLY